MFMQVSLFTQNSWIYAVHAYIYMPLYIHNFLKVSLNPNKLISTSRKVQRGSSCHLPSEEVETVPFFCISFNTKTDFSYLCTNC